MQTLNDVINYFVRNHIANSEVPAFKMAPFDNEVTEEGLVIIDDGRKVKVSKLIDKYTPPISKARFLSLWGEYFTKTEFVISDSPEIYNQAYQEINSCMSFKEGGPLFWKENLKKVWIAVLKQPKGNIVARCLLAIEDKTNRLVSIGKIYAVGCIYKSVMEEKLKLSKIVPLQGEVTLKLYPEIPYLDTPLHTFRVSSNKIILESDNNLELYGRYFQNDVWFTPYAFCPHCIGGMLYYHHLHKWECDDCKSYQKNVPHWWDLDFKNVIAPVEAGGSLKSSEPNQNKPTQELCI